MMRNKTLSTCGAIAAGIALLCACGKGKDTRRVAPEVAPAVTLAVASAPTVGTDFFMLHDDALPRSVDLTQDVSQLSYQDLRLLRAYVYATHGHFFMEADLNAFFSNHTQWYNVLCNEQWMHWDDELAERCDQYIDLLSTDYPAAMAMIDLTDDERAFVGRIDQRMEQLRKFKDIPYAAAADVRLCNPNLTANWYQLSRHDDRLLPLLTAQGLAIEPTANEQLFQIYEINDYQLMPSFITTDVMLQAYHMFFSYVLKSVERRGLSLKLDAFFHGMLSLSLQQARDADDEPMRNHALHDAAFFAVGCRLIDPATPADVPDDVAPIVESELELVMAHVDDSSPLFATGTAFSYSLFKPRGHYTRTEADQRYFRAMMWLQKGCWMREQADQLRQALYLAESINEAPAPLRADLLDMHRALCFMMGDPDNVALIEVADHLRQMGVRSLAEAISDQTRARVDTWLTEVFKTRNRIAPKQKIADQDQLNLLPQRYMIDNEVLGTLYDPEVNAARAYPTGLDVFSVLGVETASRLLAQTEQPASLWADYQSEHDRLRQQMAGFDRWDATFYNKWLQDLVVLQRTDSKQPGFMRTEAWGLKNLNTALASWALLKHDAILYGEQPIAAECGGGGDFPDPTLVGYVESNVPFWKKLRETVQLNRRMLTDLHLIDDDLAEKCDRLEELVNFCLRIADNEIKGVPLSTGRTEYEWDEYATIRHFGSQIEMFSLSVVDPDRTFDSWSLVEGPDHQVAQVADVFTRNILGCDKDGILYEATGKANALYVLVEIEGEVYLTRGATYSYYEFVRPLGDRLTDEQWQQMLDEGKAPAQPEWFAPLMIGAQTEADERFVYSTGC